MPSSAGSILEWKSRRVRLSLDRRPVPQTLQKGQHFLFDFIFLLLLFICMSSSRLFWCNRCTTPLVVVEISFESILHQSMVRHCAPIQSKWFEDNEIPAQEYRCMSWLCQMTCFGFLFFLWFFTCCCWSKEGFGEKPSDMLALRPKARFWKPQGTGTEIDLYFNKKNL